MCRMFSWCLLLFVGVAFAGQPGGAGAGIGYPDVGAGLRDLRANPEAEEVQQSNGWTWYFVREAEERFAIWTFAPFNDPAYPAAVKRVLMMRDGALVMETRTMCQANLASCDAFLAATEAYSKQFSERFASEIIANAHRQEHDTAAQLRYQRLLRDHAQSMYGRP